ncbi:MAG TPA: alpha/beta fold hydrolase [Ignavibacteria bacterium]|nr:alpha/beta fold hydrolase [Ignavibacteria bacterium]HMQ97583.1 alpha/beta fold hydrolase [Ignavibacteria bacterium]
MKRILLLHGAIGAKDQFGVLRELLSADIEVHTMNFTGHGGGEIPDEPFTIDLFERDIIRYLDANNIDEINIFGYSMGGYAALYASLNNPGRIGKIFTLATKFEWTPEIAAREVKMLDAEKMKVKVPKFAGELAKRHGEDNWVTLLKKTAEMMTGLGNKNVLTTELLKQVTNKVLVGIGDSDKMVTLEETIAAYRALTNANLIVLPATPHPIEMADCTRLVAEIKRFFG